MDADVIVMGSGMAGLAAAALTGRGGARTILLEGAGVSGGRARSTTLDSGHVLNLGPHALYRGAAAEEVLDTLGVDRAGRTPTTEGQFVLTGDRLWPIPTSPSSLLGARWLGVRGRLEAARHLARLSRNGAGPGLDDVTIGEWLDRDVADARARALLAAAVRVATYSADPSMSAAAALAQVAKALEDGVTYVHGGWQRLVDGLDRAARAHGAEVRRGVGAAAVGRDPDGGWRVRAGQASWSATSVIVAVGTPQATLETIEGSRHGSAAVGEGIGGGLCHRLETLRPVKAAVMDIALDRLPRPDLTFVLGVDKPTYLSVQSATARLAPAGEAVVHVARYLGTDPVAPSSHRQVLESLMDRAQPGWRSCLVKARFLPDMTVYGDGVPASAGGLAGRVAVDQGDGLLLAGDWVGTEGLLVDAALASARAAAGLALGRTHGPGGVTTRWQPGRLPA